MTKRSENTAGAMSGASAASTVTGVGVPEAAAVAGEGASEPSAASTVTGVGVPGAAAVAGEGASEPSAASTVTGVGVPEAAAVTGEGASEPSAASAVSSAVGTAGIRLSRRLTALAEWVPQGARFADIGTDHALLPVHLAAKGRIVSAVAGDVHAGPVAAARRQTSEAGLNAVVSVRLGDGLDVLEPGEADTVAIAGMGGSLMVRILERAGGRMDGVDTLVLSPHVAEATVRRWLAANRYTLDRELLLEEDGVIYTLMRAVRLPDAGAAASAHERLYDRKLLAPGFPEVAEQWLFEMGPLLLRAPDETFRLKWAQEMAKRERVIAQLALSAATGAAEKAAEWEQDVREIREVLACLPAEKRSYN